MFAIVIYSLSSSQVQFSEVYFLTFLTLLTCQCGAQCVNWGVGSAGVNPCFHFSAPHFSPLVFCSCHLLGKRQDLFTSYETGTLIYVIEVSVISFGFVYGSKYILLWSQMAIT